MVYEDNILRYIPNPMRATRSDNNIVLRNLMQFTGLYDLQGKEIYEGDVVEDILTDSKNNWGVVTMNPDEWEDEFITGNEMAFMYKGFLELVHRERIQIIGDIYENDLLRKEIHELIDELKGQYENQNP